MGPGYYTVVENIGRRVTTWDKKPSSATFLKGYYRKTGNNETIRKLFGAFLSKLFSAPSRAPLRSILLEEKQLKKFQRRLDYLNLYY